MAELVSFPALYKSRDAKGRSFENAIAGVDVVIAMTKFIDHGIDACIRASGGKLVRMNGGMTTLRDKLTQLFVEHGEKAAA